MPRLAKNDFPHKIKNKSSSSGGFFVQRNVAILLLFFYIIFMNHTKKRNSIIEFFRFFFAMNVVKNHGYFPYDGDVFGPGRISVEFFFTLSGWFLTKSIDKFTHLPFFKGLFLFLKNKILNLGIPLLVGLVFGLIYKIHVGMETWRDFSIWLYLWYVHDMFIVFITYYVIRYFVKNQKWYLIITTVIFVAASILHAIPRFYSWGYFRAFSGISLGILISHIPEIEMKRKWILLLPLTLAFTFVLRMLLFDFSFIEEEILSLLIYPVLIYLAFQINFNNKALDYLGSLSFGLYAYQNVTAMISIWGLTTRWFLFLILLGLTIITDLIMRLIRRFKNNQTHKVKEAVH